MADMYAIPRTSVVLAALVALQVLLASPAAATPPTEATGTIQETALIPTSFRTANGSLFLGMRVIGTFSGTYAGDFVQHLELIIHADGSVNFRGEAVCTCSIAGVGSGTLVWLVTGSGTPVSGAGSYTIVRGTGDLESAHGQGTFSAAAGVGTYTGLQHYEP